MEKVLKSFKRSGSIVGLVALVSSVSLGVQSAQAASQPEPAEAFSEASASWVSKDPVAVAEAADAAGYIIVPPSDSFEYGDGTMYPTGPISADTLVVIQNPDGSLPGGLTESTLAETVAAKRQGVDAEVSSDNNVVARASGWSPGNAVNVGSLIGWDSTARAGYTYNTRPYTAATGSGLGYEYKCTSSTYCGQVSAYYFVGFANQYTNYNTGGSAPWGNVAANRMFLGNCTSTPVCGGVAS